MYTYVCIIHVYMYYVLISAPIILPCKNWETNKKKSFYFKKEAHTHTHTHTHTHKILHTYPYTNKHTYIHTHIVIHTYIHYQRIKLLSSYSDCR